MHSPALRALWMFTHWGTPGGVWGLASSLVPNGLWHRIFSPKSSDRMASENQNPTPTLLVKRESMAPKAETCDLSIECRYRFNVTHNQMWTVHCAAPPHRGGFYWRCLFSVRSCWRVWNNASFPRTATHPPAALSARKDTIRVLRVALVFSPGITAYTLSILTQRVVPSCCSWC